MAVDNGQAVGFYSYNGIQHWMPVTSDDLKPLVGVKFKDLEEAYSFYVKYGAATGFVVRKGSNVVSKKTGIILTKNYLCNREGFKDTVDPNTSKRNRTYNRVGCQAKMVVKLCTEGGGYEVTEFVEEHCHRLVSDSQLKFEKSRRKLNRIHKKFIVDNSKVTHYMFFYVICNLSKCYIKLLYLFCSLILNVMLVTDVVDQFGSCENL